MSTPDYDSIFDKLQQRNWPYAQLWSWNAYVVDPSGDSVQFDTSWTNKPEWAKLAKDDALQNLCTQGNCAACGPSTASCSAGLAALCPGLKGGLAACQDCVHAHYAALAGPGGHGCLNPDFAQYCI